MNFWQNGDKTKVTYRDRYERLIYVKDFTWQPIMTSEYLPVNCGEVDNEERNRIYEDSIEWTNDKGNLQIFKVDRYDESKKLAGVSFTLRDNEEKDLQVINKNGKVVEKIEGKCKIGGTDYKEIKKVEGDSGDTITQFITDKNGEIFIEDLEVGKYYVLENENPIYGYENGSDEKEKLGTKKVKSGTEVTLTMKNTKETGNLRITKRDSDNITTKLEGVSFKIRYEDDRGFDDKKEYDNYDSDKLPKRYIRLRDNQGKTIKEVRGNFEIEKDGKFGLTFDKDKATTFITDEKGRIEIQNIRTGEYTVIEESVGAENEDYYEVDGKYISWSGNVEGNKHGTGNKAKIKVIRRKPGSELTNNLQVNNKRKYVNLSGYVWEDIYKQQGKDLVANGLCEEDEKRIRDIKVKLIDTTGNKVIKEVQTNTKGAYKFKKVEIDKLKNYYIEFEYNGMSYQNVIVNTDSKNGNKASEGGNRQEFNKGYETIVYGQSNKYPLKYDTTEPNQSILQYGDPNNYNYGYEGNTEPVSNVDDQYTIRANTKNAHKGENLNKIKIPITEENQTKWVEAIIYGKDDKGNKFIDDNIRKNSIKEIKNINLGIVKRQKINLMVSKDLYNVKVGINGAEQLYNYNERNNPERYKEYCDMNSQEKVKFEIEGKHGNISYTRALYASDINYPGPDKLKVQVIYEIKITNNAPEILTTINEFTDYYNSKYKSEGIKVGKKVNEKGELEECIPEENISIDENTYSREDQYGKYEYNKATIKTELEVKGENSIYIQLEVKPEKIVEILGNEESKEIVKLDNMVEITSYSSKKEGAIYAAIDVDSQPGNLIVSDTKTYENDNSKAPGLQLVLQEERKITGVVFKDETGNETLQTGKIRQGNGIYEEHESGIKDVDVKLVNITKGEVAKKYSYNKNNPEDPLEYEITATTGENGEFTLAGFIPDNYQVVYTWGDQTYKVQEYKSTIVDDVIYGRKETKDEKNDNLEWYKEEFKKDPVKDQDQKEKISIPEWNADKNKEIRVSDALDIYEERQKVDKQSEIMTYKNKTVINKYEGKLDQINEDQEDIIQKMNAVTPTFRVNVEYVNSSVPTKEEYELDENGEVKLDKNGYAIKKEGYKHIIESIDFGIARRAQQVLQLDKDVKNAKITLANGVVLIDAKIENGKIIDEVKHAVYIPESFNKGQVKFEVDSELLQSAQLEIDYSLKVTNISEWDYKNENYYKYGIGHGETEEQIVKLDSQQVIDYLDNNISLGTDNELGYMIQKEEGNGSKNELITKGLLENTNEMKQLLKDTQRVLMIEKLSEKLKPIKADQEGIQEGTSIEQTLRAHRLLSNTALDSGIDMENIAEIVKIQKTWGAPVITIPGNYTPSANNHEPDDSESQILTIVPPTGLNVNYIAYALLAISSLGILVAGIILIKKFVLK